MRETEKVLDEKITTRTEEVPCPLTGIPHLRTVEVVEKIIETEVKTQQTISCTACEFNSSHRRFVVFRTTNVLILFHFCFSHTFSPSLFHWNICWKKLFFFRLVCVWFLFATAAHSRRRFRLVFFIISEFGAFFRFASCRGDAYCLPVICKYGTTEDFPPLSSRTNCLELICLRTHVELSSITHNTHTFNLLYSVWGLYICVIVFCVEINSALHHQIYLSKCQTLSFRWQAFVNYSSTGVHSTHTLTQTNPCCIVMLSIDISRECRARLWNHRRGAMMARRALYKLSQPPLNSWLATKIK